MAKFIPGPWQTAMRQGDDWDSVVCLPDRVHEICQCFHRSRSLADKEECEANATLIASAPELLAALKAWEHWYSEDSTEFNRDTARENGLKAIAKAEGRR